MDASRGSRITLRLKTDRDASVFYRLSLASDALALPTPSELVALASSGATGTGTVGVYAHLESAVALDTATTGVSIAYGGSYVLDSCTRTRSGVLGSVRRVSASSPSA